MIIRSGPLAIADLRLPQSICSRCLHRLSGSDSARGASSRSFSATSNGDDAVRGRWATRSRLRKQFFLNHSFTNRPLREARRGIISYSDADAGGRKSARAPDESLTSTHRATSTSIPLKAPDCLVPPSRARELSHERQQPPRKGSAEVSAIVSSTNHSPPFDRNGENPTIPLDASSRLSTLSSTLPTHSLRRLLTTYLSLSKPRLTFLIVLTTTTAYSLYPVPALLLPSATSTPSLSTLTLLFLTTGTTLSSASANALNMLFEPTHDAKMSRTRNRPLVRKLISPFSAGVFAFAAGSLGLASLYYGVNPTVAFLSGLNIFLYAGVYTPLKRLHPINTWVGALVGGIPPLMGWAAAAGSSATSSGNWQELLFSPTSAGGWLLAGLLFAWQFPHFNALSWSIREEYKMAGYKMLAWMNPRRNGRVALRYAILCAPMCVGLWYVGVTDTGFLVTSGAANAWLIQRAWRFWRQEGGKGSARGLFWASVWHLPVVMVLAMVQKKGLWERIWMGVMGSGDESEGEGEDDGGDDDDDEDGGLPEPLPVPILPGLGREAVR